VLRSSAARWRHRAFLKAEHEAVQAASHVIANSERTRRDAIELLGVAPGDVHTVYYGTDADRFRPPTEEERHAARAALGWKGDAPGVVFIGALGDRRKGFDSLFEAWRSLARSESWDARLAVIGSGAEEPLWRERARRAGLDQRMSFLGFLADVRPVLWACDAIVAPSRYEAYGLAVHEAICCGLAPIVSRDAGVTEVILRRLADLQLEDPEDAWEIDSVLTRWRSRIDEHRENVMETSRRLRARTWDDMSREILRVIGERS
jgi:glycosyltransferase involved in cell wall biosynthesis